MKKSIKINEVFLFLFFILFGQLCLYAVNTPLISISGITANSITWNVRFPVSRDSGNKLELWNPRTSTWTVIVKGVAAADGTYTSSNLYPRTTYTCKLTWLENNTIQKWLSLNATTLNNPSISVTGLGACSITWKVVYPQSGASGNIAELWNPISSTWSKIVSSTSVKDNQYTSGNLIPATDYICKISWYDSGMHRLSKSLMATTLAGPSITARDIISDSISWEVRYPQPGALGNKLELQDPITKLWKAVALNDNMTNGTYTSKNLHSAIDYTCKLTWKDNGIVQERTANAKTLNAWSLSASVVTTHYIIWDANYPIPNAWGNRLELQEPGTGKWIPIGPDNYVPDGRYTANSLVAATKYTCKLSFMENGYLREIIRSVNTLDEARVVPVCSTVSSITWNARYPKSGVWGNKLELWNTVTGAWTRIVQSDTTTNGDYTINNLAPNTLFMCRLTWNENGSWKVFDVYKNTLEDRIARWDGKYVYLELENRDTSVFQCGNYERWIGHLDAAYEAYQELVGFMPDNYNQIGIKSVQTINGYPNAAALSGFPIQWKQSGIKDQLQCCNDKDDWSFGILHELSHDFDSCSWNWDAEFFANTKMYYVVVKYNISVYTPNFTQPYKGSALKNYYLNDSAESYNKCMNDKILDKRDHQIPVFSGDALTYKFIVIAEKIGWQPFIATFKNLYYQRTSERSILYEVDRNYEVRIKKFNEFLNLLAFYSNVNVRLEFTADEMSLIDSLYKTKPTSEP